MNAEETMEIKALIVAKSTYLLMKWSQLILRITFFKAVTKFSQLVANLRPDFFFNFELWTTAQVSQRSFQRGGEILGKIPYVAEVLIFSGITQLNSMVNPNMFVMIVADSEVELYMYLMSNTLFQYMLSSTFEL